MLHELLQQRYRLLLRVLQHRSVQLQLRRGQTGRHRPLLPGRLPWPAAASFDASSAASAASDAAISAFANASSSGATTVTAP